MTTIYQVTSRHLIYALIDPRTNETRYIGRSSSGLKRPRTHGYKRSLLIGDHTHNWVKSLIELGLSYEIKVLDVFSPDTAELNKTLNDREMERIAEYRRLGHRLTNKTDGGAGTLGLKLSPERKEKLRSYVKGKTYKEIGREGGNPNAIRAMNDAVRGRPKTKEHLENYVRSRGQRVTCLDDGIEYLSLNRAAAAYGISRCRVTNSCLGKSRSRPRFVFSPCPDASE